MIFATIGTQVPFERFVKMLDEVCERMNETVVCQTVGCTYKAKNIRIIGSVPPDEFGRLFSEARLIIAHAGMGTILSALRQQKPLIVVPRLAAFGEQRNDHQMATAMRMHELGYVEVAYDKVQLTDLLSKDLKPKRIIGDSASESLMKSISDFIDK